MPVVQPEGFHSNPGSALSANQHCYKRSENETAHAMAFLIIVAFLITR